MKPALSFVIPAHNAAKTLPDTVHSILAQSRADWEAIVIDDGSTDGTHAVAPGDPRVRVVRQPRTGVAAARNCGLGMAQSPAVAFIDADDTIVPEFADTMLRALEGFDLAPAAYEYRGPNLENANWVVTPTPADRERLGEFNQFAIGAFVFDRGAILRLAGTNPFPSGTCQEDWDFLLALVGARWAAPVTTPVYSYRLRPDSRTTAVCEVWRDGLNLIARHHSNVATRGAALRRWTIRNLARAATGATSSACRGMFEHLDALTAADLDILAGALRWSLRRASVARESQSLQPPAAWHAQILSALGSEEIAHEALRRAATPDWSKVAAAAAARLLPNQKLVVYGAGRNGREVIQALVERRVPFAIIDDNPATSTAIPLVTINDLSPNHLILITPDDRAPIVTKLSAKLGSTRNAQILLPEQLVA